jgi:hypothetical protein
MADSWKCQQCMATLRCSCNSMECSFDYDIRAHVRDHLVKAVEHAHNWIDYYAVLNVVERTMDSKNNE